MEINLGQLVPSILHPVKDAVHVALASVEAGEQLRSGARVWVKEGKAYTHSGSPYIGIADPFLTGGIIEKGSIFWLFMYQNTVTALRHEWTHPAFESVDGTQVRDLELIANDYGLSLDTVLHEPCDDWCMSSDSELPERFWALYQVVTGKVLDEIPYISCAC